MEQTPEKTVDGMEQVFLEESWKTELTLNGTSILTYTNTGNIAESPGSVATITVNDTAQLRQTANTSQTAKNFFCADRPHAAHSGQTAVPRIQTTSSSDSIT